MGISVYVLWTMTGKIISKKKDQYSPTLFVRVGYAWLYLPSYKFKFSFVYIYFIFNFYLYGDTNTKYMNRLIPFPMNHISQLILYTTIYKCKIDSLQLESYFLYFDNLGSYKFMWLITLLILCGNNIRYCHETKIGWLIDPKFVLTTKLKKCNLYCLDLVCFFMQVQAKRWPLVHNSHALSLSQVA